MTNVNDYASLTILGRLSDEVISGLGMFGDFSFNKLMIMLTGEEEKHNTIIADIEKIPQLPVRNTKEFRSIINGNIEKPSSVALFNWISYTQKSLKQKEVPMTDVKLPEFIKVMFSHNLVLVPPLMIQPKWNFSRISQTISLFC